jgi:hypothetical protein
MTEIFKEVQKTREEGQNEYAHDTDNAFANFDRVAEKTETTREKVLLTYLLKHIDGITAYAKGHKSQREDVRGRIKDCIVYLCLFWGMVDCAEEPVNQEDNMSFTELPEFE